MSIAPNTGRLLVLTARKSDLEYKLTMMLNTNQRLAQENADILEQKSTAVKNYIANLTTGTDAAPTININESAEIVKFDVQLQQLALAQDRLDIAQKKLETEQKAVVAEEDGVQKLVDSSIKNEMSYFKD